MTKKELKALRMTLRDVGVRRMAKSLSKGDLMAGFVRVAAQTGCTVQDLEAEYRLNLQEAELDKLAENHGRG